MKVASPFRQSVVVFLALLLVGSWYQPGAEAQEKNPKLDINPAKPPTKASTAYPAAKLVVKQVIRGKSADEVKVLIANTGTIPPTQVSVEVALVGFSGKQSAGELWCGYFTGEYAGCHRTQEIATNLLPQTESWVGVKFWNVPPDISKKNDWKKLTEFGYRVTARYRYKPGDASSRAQPVAGEHSLYVKYPLAEK